MPTTGLPVSQSYSFGCSLQLRSSAQLKCLLIARIRLMCFTRRGIKKTEQLRQIGWSTWNRTKSKTFREFSATFTPYPNSFASLYVTSKRVKTNSYSLSPLIFLAFETAASTLFLFLRPNRTPKTNPTTPPISNPIIIDLSFVWGLLLTHININILDQNDD